MSGHLGHVIDCEYTIIYYGVNDLQSTYALLLYLSHRPSHLKRA